MCVCALGSSVPDGVKSSRVSKSLAGACLRRGRPSAPNCSTRLGSTSISVQHASTDVVIVCTADKKTQKQASSPFAFALLLPSTAPSRTSSSPLPLLLLLLLLLVAPRNHGSLASTSAWSVCRQHANQVVQNLFVAPARACARRHGASGQTTDYWHPHHVSVVRQLLDYDDSYLHWPTVVALHFMVIIVWC